MIQNPKDALWWEKVKHEKIVQHRVTKITVFQQTVLEFRA